MKEQTVLVTGGAGFIGSNVANTLADKNDVIAIDDCSLGTPDNLDEAVDFREINVLSNDIPRNIDVLIHLAALSSYAMHEKDPALGARVNIEGFVNCIEHVRSTGCDSIVYASTSSIYGTQTTPTPETGPINANSGYEASKLARERYAEYFANHYDLNIAGIRFFSVYQGYGGAETHKNEYANVIAQFADDIAHDRSPKLYGDGTQTRDFVHVSDVARGIELVADHHATGIYNLGTGERYSFNTVIDHLNEELGTSVEPTYVENPIPDDVYVHDTCGDSSKLQAETGWEPQIDFETGIELVCQYYQ